MRVYATAQIADAQTSSSGAPEGDVPGNASTRPMPSVDITIFVDAEDVQRALKCSRTSAYGHLRKATGRTNGRGMLRAPVSVWEEYVSEVFGCDSTNTGRPGTRTSRLAVSAKGGARAARTGKQLKQWLESGSEKRLIPITQPRRKRPSAMQ
jgi:hypothetical protein